MKISKVSDKKVTCELTEEELNSMDLWINTLMDDEEKTGAFMNALLDVAAERTNLVYLKEVSFIDFFFDDKKKMVMVNINSIDNQSMPFDITDRLESLLQYDSDMDEPGEDQNSEGDRNESEEDEYILDYNEEDYLKYRSSLEKMADKAEYTGIVYMKFSTLDEIGTVIRNYNKTFQGESILLKKDRNYFFILSFNEDSKEEYEKMIFVFADFVAIENIQSVRKAYMEEHYETIVKEDAFNKLKQL